MVPYYVRPSEAAIVAHFQAVAARSPVPLVLYNIPYRTGRGLGAAALLELAGTEGIVGLKQAVGALDADTLQLLARAPRGLRGAVRRRRVHPAAAAHGRRAARSPPRRTCAPSASPRSSPRAAAGRLDEARAHAEALLPLVLALFAEPSPAVLKAMLHEAGRIATPDVRMPLQAASPAALERARRSAPSRWSARAPARAR